MPTTGTPAFDVDDKQVQIMAIYIMAYGNTETECRRDGIVSYATIVGVFRYALEDAVKYSDLSPMDQAGVVEQFRSMPVDDLLSLYKTCERYTDMFRGCLS